MKCSLECVALYICMVRMSILHTLCLRLQDMDAECGISCVALSSALCACGEGQAPALHFRFLRRTGLVGGFILSFPFHPTNKLLKFDSYFLGFKPPFSCGRLFQFKSNMHPRLKQVCNGRKSGAEYVL